MPSLSFRSLLTASAYLYLILTADAINPQLIGTWTTKSAKVITGPGFYNPVNDSFIEPSLTGISYSFTTDGFYEEAYYRAVSNPTNPQCPSAVMQFQHGTYTENADGSLSLTPFAVDGRQLTSNPCKNANSIYERYNQSETFKKYQVSKDAYHSVMRLDLYKFDGSPMNPMFIAYTPPLMLPTQTMNPTATASGASSTSAAAKRDLHGEELEVPLNKDAKHIKRENQRPQRDWLDASLVWWIGLGMTVFGGAAYLL